MVEVRLQWTLCNAIVNDVIRQNPGITDDFVNNEKKLKSNKQISQYIHVS